MRKAAFFVILLVAAFASYAQRPEWIDKPGLYGIAHYERGVEILDDSPWIYMQASSANVADEQTARTRARQTIQAEMAAKIATEFAERTDITGISLALLVDEGREEMERLIETAISLSVKTKVPGFEILEHYIEKGNLADGRVYYKAFVLVRFQKKAVFETVQKIDPKVVTGEIAKLALKELGINLSNSQKNEVTAELAEAKEEMADDIRNGRLSFN